MIRFRDTVQDTTVVNAMQTENLFGFEREAKGYFVVNVSPLVEETIEVQTTLPDGSYLDLLGDRTYDVVGGKLTMTVSPLTAIALVKN